MPAQTSVLRIWDYVVLALVLLISAAIGVYYRFTGGRQKTNKEYLLADKNMSLLPVILSLAASFMSAISLLGVSSENYSYGSIFILINFAYGLFTPVTVYLFLPVFFKLQTTSAYEYLERRFGKSARLCASLCYSLQMILYMGVVLYAPSLALEAVTGLNTTAAILSVGLVCTFYSTMGGMKAVLMTDVFQTILMFVAVLSVIIGEWIYRGSLSEIWRIAVEGGRINFNNFDPDPTIRHSWWSLFIGGGVTYLSLYAVNQTQVQRYLTLKNLKRAQLSAWLNWPILTALSLCTSFAGLCIYSRYHDCDPLTSGVLTSQDQLMPYYVVKVLGHIPGMSGLFIAGIFSAALSTISAGVNSLAAIILEDYWKPLHSKIYKKPMTENGMAYWSKLISFCVGIAFLGLAFIAQFLGSVLQAALTIFGVVGGPVLGLFTLGMFTTRANEIGAVTGTIAGLVLSLWAGFGSPRPSPEKLPMSTEGCANSSYSMATSHTLLLSKHNDTSQYFWLYRVSYLYDGVIGFLAVLVIGYFVSYIAYWVGGKKEKPLDPNLFVPPLAKRLEKRSGNALQASVTVPSSYPKISNSVG